MRTYLQSIGHYQRSEEHTSELQSHVNVVCRLLLEKKKVVAARAAQHDPGAAEDVRRPDWPGYVAVAAGHGGGCHLGREHLAEHAGHRVAVEHQFVHLSFPSARTARF